MKKWMAIYALGLIPFVFLPVTQDFYDSNKLMLLVGAAGFLSLISGIAQLSKKRPPLLTLSLPVLGFGILSCASLISLVFASTSKVDALMSPLGIVALISITILASVLSNASDELKTYGTRVFIGSSTILALIAIYQFVGMGRVMFPGIGFLQDALWSPTGTTTTTIAVLAVAIAILLPLVFKASGKRHSDNALIFYISSLLILVAGLSITLIQFVPKIASSVIPLSAAWAVTVEVLKHVKSALVGVGAENFVSAYTLAKPVSMIATDLWNVRFGVNANFFFHMITVYGGIGGIAAVFFLLVYIKYLTNTSLYIAILTYILCLIIIPPSLTLLTIGAVLLVLADNRPKYSLTLPVWTRFILGTLLFLFGLLLLYISARAYTGELRYFTALTATKNNEGTPAYNYHLAAIRTNPRVPRYHITYSQVNLSLANSIAAAVSEQATGSDSQQNQNRQLVGQLIEQAIAEAKTAVTLNPQSIVAWENLGITYQALMPVAPRSDTWAAAAYQKALTLDPTNPVLLVNLGNALAHEKKYDDAIRAFERAAALKPDYANAYYNMADAYRLKGDTFMQKDMLLKALNLVQPGSSDYVKVTNELDRISSVPE